MMCQLKHKAQVGGGGWLIVDILSVGDTEERPDAVGWAGWIASVDDIRLLEEGDGVIGFSFLCLGRGLFRFRRCRRLDFFGGSVRPRRRNGWESALLVGDGTGLVSTAGGGSGSGLHAFILLA